MSSQAIFVRKNIERSVRDLPALPAAVMRVMEEMDRPEPSSLKIEEYILADQALTAQVLRVVNSAYYGMSRQIGSVSQAIVILGLHQIKNIVLSVGTMSAFEAKNPRQAATIQQMWIRAFGTAACSQYIARRKRLDPRTIEVMFVAGLLHDLGRFFLMLNYTDLFERVEAKAKPSTPEYQAAERDIYGLTHGEAGHLIASRWRLPDTLLAVIESHEGPFSEGDSPVLLGVHAAEAFQRLEEAPEANGLGDLTMDPYSIQWLAFSDEDVQATLLYSSQKKNEAKTLFGVAAAA